MTSKTASPRFAHPHSGDPLDPEVEGVVRDIIGRIANKWSLVTLEVLSEHGRLRFSDVRRRVGSVSQKVLTQVLRGLEEDGLLSRTVHPEVPPRVEYELTALGHALSHALCGVWQWAERHRGEVAQARARFSARHPDEADGPD